MHPRLQDRTRPTLWLLACAALSALGGPARGAGERALLPMPASFSEAQRERFEVDRQRIAASLSDAGADAGARLVGRVLFHQNGVPAEYFVMAPADGAPVGEAEQLTLTPAPGAPATLVALAETVVGFENDPGLEGARGVARRAGYAGEMSALPSGLAGVYVLRTASALEAFDAANTLLALPGVSWAHPNGRAARATLGTGGVLVTSPEGTNISDGGIYNFGSTTLNVPITKTFTLQNAGSTEVALNMATATGGFTVLTQPASPIPPSQSTTFDVRLDATITGAVSGQISFGGTPAGSPAFTFSFTATATVNPPGGGGGDDPLFVQQWHLLNTGQNNGTAGYDINILPAWLITRGLTPGGQAVRVAVGDDGSMATHPDIQENVQQEIFNAFDAPTCVPENGLPGAHGTSVAGCVAAKDNNGLGGRGSAPAARLILSNMFYSAVTPAIVSATFAENADAITNAVNAGAAVHTNSWTFVPPSFLPDVIRVAFQSAMTNGRGGLGTAVLFAAGNSGRPIQYTSALASMPGVFAVGAMSNKGFLAPYSSYGPLTEYIAPSSGGSQGTLRITTTDVVGPFGYNSETTEAGGDYVLGGTPAGFGGTSAATPISAGAVALVIAANPALRLEQVRRIIRHTCRTDLAPALNVSPFDGLTRRSDTYGHGLIDAGAAVAAAAASTKDMQTWPASPINLTVISRNASGTTIGWTNPGTDGTGEYAGTAMVVRYSASTAFRPVDGETYTAGRVVDTGTRIMAVGDISTFTDTAVSNVSSATYAVYTLNLAGRWSIPSVVTVNLEEPIDIFFDNFESDLGWASQMGGEWERGTPNYVVNPFLAYTAAFSGANVFATDLDGLASASFAQHVLTSPVINLTLTNPIFNGRLPNSLSVSWKEIIDSIGQGRDTVLVEVIEAGAPGDGPGGTPPVILRTLLSSNFVQSLTWRERWFDIRSARGKFVQFRFTYILNTSVPTKGWLLDDFRIRALFCTTCPIIPGRPRRIILPGFFLPAGDGGASVAIEIPADASADLNRDGAANFTDLNIVLSAFGQSLESPGYVSEADIDLDGEVGFRDLGAFFFLMAEANAPASPAPAGGSLND